MSRGTKQLRQGHRLALRAIHLEAAHEDESFANHFIQLATASRLDRLGRALVLTTQGLARWTEAKLRTVYKDKWRTASIPERRTSEGDTPDLLELQRLIGKNES